MRPQIISDDELLSLILDAFADLGYEGTSVRALCRHLNVSHNLIHQRYGSKEKMWYAAVDHGFRSTTADVLAGEPTFGADDDVERLRTLILRMLEAVRSRPALVRLVTQEATRPSPRFDYMLESYVKPMLDRLEAFLGHLQERGQVRPGPVMPAFYFLVFHGLGSMGALPELAARLDGGEDATHTAVDLFLTGLTTTPAQLPEIPHPRVAPPND